MEQVGRSHMSYDDHVIDIRSGTHASSSGLPNDLDALERPMQEDRSSINAVNAPASQLPGSSSNELNSRISSSIRRGNGHNNLPRISPVNSGLWISVELVLITGQIIAAIVVLSLSRHEHPRAPLFAWIVGYACACVATLPRLYWRYWCNNRAIDQDLSQARQSSPRNNPPIITTSFSSLSTARLSEIDDSSSTITTRQGSQTMGIPPRLKAFVKYFKMALDCFSVVWFVVGNVWIFGGHSSPSEAPNLYRLCLVFLIFSWIGYVMPFIICFTIFCCIPRIISFLEVSEESTQNTGATSESINSLPIYKFKTKKGKSSSNGKETNSSLKEGGVIAAGTDKERTITGEDAACCICLVKYAHNDELRELPCTHLFHKECVDKWLKMIAFCPLCKDAGTSVAAILRN